MISEQAMEIDEVLCACFVDWQEAFDRVKWNKLMQIINETGIEWRIRRLYLYRHVKVQV